MSYRYLVNGRQTKEERRAKYKALRKIGLDYYDAVRLRDWTINHIVLFLNSNNHNAEKFKKAYNYEMEKN